MGQGFSGPVGACAIADEAPTKAAATAKPSEPNPASTSKKALDRWGSAVAVMMHFHGRGESHVHGKWGRAIELYPDGKSLRHHDPIEVAADDRKTGAVLVRRLHTRAQACHPPHQTMVALGHRPHRSAIANGNSRQF